MNEHIKLEIIIHFHTEYLIKTNLVRQVLILSGYWTTPL